MNNQNAVPLTSLDDVLKTLSAATSYPLDQQTLGIGDALYRVLAEDVQSSIDVPGFDNSAVDGYAFNLNDEARAKSDRLKLDGRVAAGDYRQKRLEPGSCVQVFTGAPIPDGANAVVMQEFCKVDKKRQYVSLPQDVVLYQNIREKGQDIKQASTILKKGKRLEAHDLGLLASIGLPQVNVFRRLKVAIFSSGDEIVEPGQTLALGQIYNANRYSLVGILKSWDVDVIDLGSVADNATETQRRLLEASQMADCIITSGGVSVGDEDHIRRSVEALGSIDLWRIAIKPGKPFAYGRVHQTPFIGLPGNPAAVIVTMLVIVRAYIQLLKGQMPNKVGSIFARAGFHLLKPSHREQYLFARLELTDSERPVIKLYPNQSSGVLSSSSWADGLVKVPIGHIIEKGERIEYIPFSSLYD